MQRRKLRVVVLGSLLLSMFMQSAGLALADDSTTERKEKILRALSDIYLKQGKFELAITELNALCALLPQDAMVRFQYAKILMNQSKYKQAIPLLQKAANLDSTSADYWGLLGDCYMQTAQYGLAQSVYTKAIRYQRAGGTDWRQRYQLAQQYIDHQKLEQNYKQEQQKRNKEQEEDE